MLDGVRAGLKSYDSLLAIEKAVPTMCRRRGASMLCSSGTTGRPKGVRVPLSDDPPEVPPQRLAMLQRLGGTYTGF